MKQRTVILVDGENISYKKADEITALSRRLGNVVERKVYHRQKDPITRMWNKKTAYKNIHIPGEAEHNKIDHRIQKDARKYNRPICFYTSNVFWSFSLISSCLGFKAFDPYDDVRIAPMLRSVHAPVHTHYTDLSEQPQQENRNGTVENPLSDLL